PRAGRLERARPVPRLAQPALRDELVHVLVDGGDRREAELRADLLEARRVAVLLDEGAHEVVDLSLTAGQGHPNSTKARRNLAEPPLPRPSPARRLGPP